MQSELFSNSLRAKAYEATGGKETLFFVFSVQSRPIHTLPLVFFFFFGFLCARSSDCSKRRKLKRKEMKGKGIGLGGISATTSTMRKQSLSSRTLQENASQRPILLAGSVLLEYGEEEGGTCLGCSEALFEELIPPVARDDQSTVIMLVSVVGKCLAEAPSYWLGQYYCKGA